MKNIHAHIFTAGKKSIAAVLAVSMIAASARQAHAITYDSAAGEYFDTIDDNGLAGGSSHITMRFGSTLGEYLRFNQTLGKFVLSDDLDVVGTVSGSLVTQNGAGTNYFRGNVGIGQTAADTRLDVLGTISGSLLTQNGAGTNYLRGNVGIGQTAADTRLDVLGTVSGSGLQVNGASVLAGNVGIGAAATTTKARLSVNGTLSGVTLYATKSFSGAGLTDCDTGASSKLLWDATTGRFSCGTDQTGGGSSGGLSLSDADARYVNTRGDTMTGKLLLQNTSIEASSGTFLGLDSNDDVVLAVKGGSMNMSDLQQWKDSSNTILVNIGADGNIGAGNATFSGNLTANGSNITLGDANTDNVSVTGDVNTDLNPEYGGMQNLGNTSARWNGWFYNVDTSNDLNVGNNVSTSNLSASSYTNLSYLNVSNSISFTNYTGGGSGCSALETDSMGSLVCGTDDSSGGWGTDYFTVSNGSASETIDETNTLTFAAADSNISVNVGMTDTVTIGFNNPGFITSESDPTYYSNPYGYVNSSNDNIGNDTYFNITDGLTTETINTFDAITFLDGNNINVSVYGTDNVNISTTDNVSFTNLNVSDGSSFGDNIADQMNISAGSWTFNNDTNFSLSGGVNGLSFDTDTLSIDAFNDRVGIGTTAPKTDFDVVGTISGSFLNTGQVTIKQPSTVGIGLTIDTGANADNNSILSLKNGGTGGHEYWLESTAVNNGFGVGKFLIWDNTASANRFIIDTAGNVGLGGMSTADYKLDVNGAMIAAPPSTQTIASNGTITADACGTVKLITASSSVTTNTTNTFTAPSAANAGCVMHVINTASPWVITLDANTNFKTPSGVNVTLSPLYAVTVVSSGSAWYVMASPSSNF